MKLTCDRTATQHYGDETGKRYFSISQVLKCLDPSQYDGVPPDVLEQAARRGKAVHFYFSFLMGSRLRLCPAPDMIPAYEGYCRALLAWADTNKPEPMRLEESSVWASHGLAGTPDMLCLYSLKRVATLVELKTTSQPHRLHRTQVALQRRLSGYEQARALRLLYVHADGSYDDEYVTPSPMDEAAALNAIQVLRWRAQS